MKKVLVTGAGGFIGSHVVEELLKENIEVRALIRPGESLTNLKGMEIEKVEGDVLKNKNMFAFPGGINIVDVRMLLWAMSRSPRKTEPASPISSVTRMLP